MLPESSNSSIAKMSITCTTMGFDMSFISLKKEEILHCGFAVLLGWANSITLPIEVFSQLHSPYMFPTKSFRAGLLHEIILNMQGVPLNGTKPRFWNTIVNVVVIIVNKRSVCDGNGCYLSTIRVHVDYLEHKGARVTFVIRKPFFDVCLGWISARLNLDGPYDNKL